MKFKYALILTLVFALQVKALGNEFTNSEVYAEILQLVNVEGKKQEALELAKALRKKLAKENRLYQELGGLVDDLDTEKGKRELEKAKKFVSGEKDEVYCKGKGLVYLEARHNDGTKSEVKLISSNRKLLESYSVYKSGEWVYELDTEYREPIQSDSWVINSSKNSYKIKELRKKNSSGRPDRGRFSWKSSGSHSFTTNGEGLEPAPMLLATDYHLWGTRDLGYTINFKVGSKDKLKTFENTRDDKRINLAVTREVIRKLSSYSYYDAEGKPYPNKDCFLVNSKIKVTGVESRGRKKR